MRLNISHIGDLVDIIQSSQLVLILSDWGNLYNNHKQEFI
mgnify:CR=1 FL=1